MQITLTGNKISSTGGNQLVADLTGDGVDDVTFGFYTSSGASVSVQVNGAFPPVFAGYFSVALPFRVDAQFASYGVGLASASGATPQSIQFLNGVSFTDARINGGAPTNGYLQVNAFNTSSTDHTVELSRLIFDDASTTRPAFTSIPGAQTEWGAVPEPTSLGLLALGAGGLLLRRSRAKAAA